MTAPAGGEHWTKVLYERYPDLYLPILEMRRAEGAKEAAGVSATIDAAGAKKGGKVLDLACGIGRHSVPLAKLGYQVVGMDLSSLFIERARSLAQSQGLTSKNPRFYTGDFRSAAESLRRAGETDFDAIISLFSSVGAYGEAEDEKVLGDLLEVAAPSCVLVVETLNRDFLLRRFQSYNIQAISPTLRLIDVARFNPDESTLEDDWRFYTELPDGTLKPELNLKVSGRVYTLHELRKLAERAGWSYAASYGSLVAPGPVTAESPSVVLVCRKA